MNNLEKYKKAFISALNIDKRKFSQNLKYNEIPEWDSIGHMTLISSLENEFNISIENDDVLDFSSFKQGIKILKKYKVN